MHSDAHERTRALIESFNEARNAHDRARIATMVTEDVEFVYPASLGLDAVRGESALDVLAGGTVGRYFELSTVERELTRIIVDRDVAAVEQTMTAKTLTGRDYSNRYVFIYELRDGKISRLIEHADTLAVARALDLV